MYKSLFVHITAETSKQKPSANSKDNDKGIDPLLELSEDIIFLQILPKLNSLDVLPLVLVARSWASFLLQEGPKLMLFNPTQNPTPKPTSILFDVSPIPYSVSILSSPESLQLCQSRCIIVPILNSGIKHVVPIFEFLKQGEVHLWWDHPVVLYAFMSPLPPLDSSW